MRVLLDVDGKDTVRLAHHSDDVILTGPREHLVDILKEIKNKLDCSHRFIGLDG